jgi:hypothetical protein
MLKFIDLKQLDGRNVSWSYTDKKPEHVTLLGVIPHCTVYERKELILFAKKILEAFDEIGG